MKRDNIVKFREGLTLEKHVFNATKKTKNKNFDAKN